MKVSLKVEENHRQNTQSLLLRTKIPVTVFGFPFLSGFTTSDHSSHDFSLSLRTNFPSGPSLKLSYIPSPRAAASPPSPLTLTLKSGVSLSGSPNNSPLIISANFSFSPLTSTNPIPTFSLQFKPQFGDFSLRKSIFSDPKPDPNVKGDVNSVGVLPLERSRVWKELGMEGSDKEPIFTGVAMMANTKMPVAKRVAVNFRWGVSFPGDLSKQMPFLSVNKIGIERVDEVIEENVISNEKNVGDSEMLKGMFSWMKSELDSLRQENREMKHNLEELKKIRSVRSGGEKVINDAQNSSGFDQWRRKKTVAEENVKKESKKVENPITDVESELQKAIKAASSI